MDEGYPTKYSVCLRVISECVDYHLRLNHLPLVARRIKENKENGWRPGEYGAAVESMTVTHNQANGESHMYP